MEKDLKNALPIYTVVNVAKFPLNPYREFSYYCLKNIYPMFDGMFGLSLYDIRDLSVEARKALLNAVTEKYPDITFSIPSETSHPRVFLEFEVLYKGSKACKAMFYNHMYYAESSANNTDVEYVACDLDFTENEELDFLNINREFNIFDFTRSSEDKNTVDMIFSHIYGLCNFTDFLRYFKTKSLTVKNIEMFAKKMIEPYVQDMAILYSSNNFSIGSICGDEVNKDTFTYDNYLNSVKQYAEAIREKYGDKYKLEKERAEREASVQP